MSDVTVRIQGVGSGGGGNNPNPPTPPTPPTPPPNAPTGPAGGGAPIAPDNRLVEDIRRAIMARGAVYIPTNNTYKPIISQVEQQQRLAINDSVHKKYEEKRWEIYGKRDEVIDQQLKAGATDEQIGIAVKDFDRELDALDRAEEAEKNQKQDELTRAIEELTESINRTGSLNPNSYLGELRQQRQEAIFERDNAEDEETAKAAAQRVQEIDKQIRDVTDGRVEEAGVDFGSRVLQTMLGADQLIKGIAGKNIGSTIMGAGQSVTALLGASDETAAKTLAWLTPVAGLFSIFQEEAQRSDQMAGLAALTRNMYGGNMRDARTNMYTNLWNFDPGTGVDMSELGLSVPDFAQSAERRISQRGMAEYGVSEAYFQEALERVFSLNRGSLGDAGKYDRYGMTGTEAIVNLVQQLERISNSGVSQGNYARVQEYLGIQQDLMANYMRFSDKPSQMNANRDIAAFASLEGYTVDSRTAGDIKAVQNMLINPQNDRMKAILYGVVEETVPEYKGQSVRGRVDLIDQILHDEKYQGIIEKALIEQLTAMYGGSDTPMGYLMIKSQLQGVESPERREAIWNGILRGKAGQTLSSGYEYSNPSGAMSSEAVKKYVKDIEGYVSSLSSSVTEMSDAVFNTASFLEKMFNKMSDGIRLLAE
jgi:hypothetical protein